MTGPAATDDDPVRAAILAAMDRLLVGAPQHSEGRLSVSQLAAEAGVKRWHLTHQHTDLKDLFQARVRQSQSGQAASARTASAYEELKAKYAGLQRHCSALEDRLQLYATTINALTLENAALAGRAAGSARGRPADPPGGLIVNSADLVLVDGHNLPWIAAMGTPASVSSRDGSRDLTGVFMFFALLRKAIRENIPGSPEVLVVFDGEQGSAARKAIDPGYKANRTAGDPAASQEPARRQARP